MALDQSIAEECVDFALFFGINPHYMVAVAQKRSKLTDAAPAGGFFGPFQLSRPEWEAHRNDNEFHFNFTTDQITSWRRTCDVFAIMTYRTQNALIGQNLNALPSVLDLYSAQWPAEATSTSLVADLQAALDATAALIGPAAKTLDDPGESGGVVTDPSKPIDPAPKPTTPTPPSSFGAGPFKIKAPLIMSALMADFRFTPVQAAGILGNLGEESGGLRIFHEIGKPPDQGGVGWAQWTADRRRNFESFCRSQRLDPTSNEANYGFLSFEMTQTDEKKVVTLLRRQSNLSDAVTIFMKTYERAGVEAFLKRLQFAQIALNAFQNPAAIGGKMA